MIHAQAGFANIQLCPVITGVIVGVRESSNTGIRAGIADVGIIKRGVAALAQHNPPPIAWIGSVASATVGIVIAAGKDHRSAACTHSGEIPFDDQTRARTAKLHHNARFEC